MTAGDPTYVISKEWIDKYKKYCFYSSAKYGTSPSTSETHLEQYAPGKILNEEVIHIGERYLQGTGKQKNFEKEVYDRFLHKDKREKMHFEFISEE